MITFLNASVHFFTVDFKLLAPDAIVHSSVPSYDNKFVLYQLLLLFHISSMYENEYLGVSLRTWCFLVV